jgi:hypothetical protein
MNTLGPYVVFSNSRPSAWCYFKLDPSNIENPISFYKAPYTAAGGDVAWTESPLEDKSPVYLYDTKEEKPCCYVMDAGNLYDAPLQSLAGKPHVNQMRHIALNNNEITRHLANRKKARDYQVTIEEYPQLESISEIYHHLPDLPITEPVATTSAPSTPFVSSDTAKESLEVTQCIQVKTEADSPVEIDKGCMYVWKIDGQWSFKVNFLGNVKTGVFDKDLDHDVAVKFNSQPLGNITPEINSIRHNLNRPYLNLTPHQQAILVATMTPDWPLTDKMSPNEQIQACRTIVRGSALSEDTPLSKEINSDINAFRPYLFPSTINSLYEHNALFTSTPAPTIADIIFFTDYLLIGAAQALGDESPFTIAPSPNNSHVICGQLQGIDNQSRLIYQGLSEGQSELFNLIMNVEVQGMEAMPIKALIQMEPLLHAVMEPSEQGHELIDLSSDLIASIAAQQNITHEAAKDILKTTCDRMIVLANKTAFIKLISMTREEALETLQTSTNEKFNTLIKWFFEPSDSAQANRDTVLQHQDPEVVAVALVILHKAGLLAGDSAQANFNTVLQHKNPRIAAYALTTLHEAGMLAGDAAQANFNAVFQHQDPEVVAVALVILHEAGMLAGDSAQANRDAVFQHQNPHTASFLLATLYEAGLLAGDSAQANRDAVFQHQNPHTASFLLATLYEAGLLAGDLAQTNRDAVLQHQEPLYVAAALAILHEAGLLAGEPAQANFNAVLQHKDPRTAAAALAILHEAGLLAGESAQVNRDAVAQSQNPRVAADALATLHEAGLLEGDSAQANFNAVLQHQDPRAAADALATLHKAGMLAGDSAQANRDSVAHSQNPSFTATFLIQNKMKATLDGLKSSDDDNQNNDKEPGPNP